MKMLLPIKKSVTTEENVTTGKTDGLTDRFRSSYKEIPSIYVPLYICFAGDSKILSGVDAILIPKKYVDHILMDRIKKKLTLAHSLKIFFFIWYFLICDFQPRYYFLPIFNLMHDKHLDNVEPELLYIMAMPHTWNAVLT